MGHAAISYNFDEVIDRRHDPFSYSSKWSTSHHTAEHCGVSEITDDHIALFTADMDFRCAQPILDALRATVDHGIFGYSTLDASERYSEAVKGWFARRDGWRINPDLMLYCSGTVRALQYAVEAFTRPGDGVIIQRPVYPPFTSSVEDARRTVLNNQLMRHVEWDEQGDLYYTMDFDGLEQLAARPEATMLILCNPHNPVGRVWSEDELRRVADICTRNGVMIVADEIHGDLLRPDATMCHLAQVAPYARVMTCTAVNKTFNLAGLAATNLVFSDARDRVRFERVMGFAEPSPFAISAVIAAYEQGEEWLEQCRAYLDGNIDAVIEFFAERLPDVRVRRPEGTYVLWIDFEDRCRALGIDADELHRRVYEEAKVILQDGVKFDPVAGAFFQRMCVPSPRSVLLEACERIADVLAL